MENKILVTGGYGLVGSEFAQKKYVKPTSRDVDFRKSSKKNAQGYILLGRKRSL